MRPLVIAHRGASRQAPENTIEAFSRARDLGADGVELDVRETADGALAIHHDEALGDGRHIAALATADLPADVALLDAVLDVCRGMLVNVEIKAAPASSVVALLEGRGGEDRVLVSSFDFEVMAEVRRLDPALPTAWLTFALPDPLDAVARTAAAGHVAINPFVLTVDEALVAAAHGAGLDVHVYTTDDPDMILRLADMGVDGIFTNEPDVALRVLAGR